MESLRLVIPNELFAPAESLHYEGTINIDQLHLGPDEYTFKKPIMWNVDITNTGGAFLVMGTAEGAAQTSCARCLDDVEYALVGEIEGYFVMPGEGVSEQLDLEEDEFDILPDDNAIDLAPLIESALLLELPLLPLCSDDCKGLCAQCGVNLNHETCDCKTEEDDHASHPFAALANLTFTDEEFEAAKAAQVDQQAVEDER